MIEIITPPVRGAGGGKSKSSSTGRAPYEAPNTLRSKATAYVMDILSEGQIEGLVDGLKSVYLDDTPLMAADGSYNFQGVNLALMGGLPDQSAPAAFIAELNSREVPVGQLVSQKNGPVLKSVNTTPLTRVRVTLRVPALFRQNKTNGDVTGADVYFRIHIKAQDTGWIQVVYEAITGKCTSPYEKSFSIPLQGTGPWQVRVTRDSPDTDDDTSVQDTLYWASYTEILDWRLDYPNTAYMGLALDAELFGGTIPQRAYHIRGIKMLLPENYDPWSRTYAASGPGTTGGVWNGSLAKYAWSNNPAWIFYDLLTNTRYGLGSQIKPSMVDKWALYEIAQYCDQLVPDGKGGWEPRFTFNGVINTRDDAYSVLQAVAATFRGMVYWGGGTITATQDRPASPVKLVTNANVLGGSFSYEGTSLRSRHTMANVLFTDSDDNFKPDIEPVSGKDLGRRGVVPLEIVALGLSKRTQARRIGRWALDIEQNETQTCTYRGGLDQVDVRPGDIVLIADRWWQGARFGGRIVSTSGATVTVDSPVIIDGSQGWLKATLPDGTLEDRWIVSPPGTYTTLAVEAPFSQTPQPDSVWMVSQTSVQPRPHRVIAMAEVDKHVYEITALFHDETKYDRIDFGINRAPPSFSLFPTGAIAPPSDISFTEYQVITNGAVRAMMTVSWVHSTDARVRSYIVEVKRPTDPGYTRVGDAFGNSIDVGDITDGIGAVRVRAVDALGRTSIWTERTGLVFLGLKWVPDNVSTFSADVVDGVLQLTWGAVRQQKSVVYRIKYTPSLAAPAWQSASTLVDAVDGLHFAAPPRDGAYLIKAVSLAGVECASAALIITNAVSLALFNVIATVVEDPAWAGVKTGTVSDGARLLLAPDQLQGTYEFSGPDIGEASIVRITAAVDAYGTTAEDIMVSWNSLAEVEHLSSGKGEDWTAGLEYRTTVDDPAEEGWSAWKPFSMVDVEARQVQFRLTIASLDNGTTKVEVGGLIATIDVPDRVEAGNDIAISAAGQTITFNENFRLTPAIAVTGQDLATGDYWTISGQNRTGFTIRFFNAAGVGVARTADWLAKGYGRERGFVSRKHFRATLDAVATLSTPVPIQAYGAVAHLGGGADDADIRASIQPDATSGPPLVGASGAGGALPLAWYVTSSSTPWEVVGSGVQFGIEYCDIRFVGNTSTASNSLLNFGPAGSETRDVVAGQAWQNSLYIAIVGGDLTNITGINARVGFAGQAQPSQALSPDGVFRRYDFTFGITTATSIANYGVQVLHAIGAAIDITLRVGRPFIGPLRLITARTNVGMTATLAASSGLAVISRAKYSAKATLAAAGSLRSWIGAKQGAAKLSGVGSVAVKGQTIYTAKGTVGGVGSVIANPKASLRMVPGAIRGVAALTASPKALLKPRPAAIGGVGTVAAYAAGNRARSDFMAATMPGVPTLTHARSTKGWYFAAPVGGSRPVLTEAAVDTPTWDWDPALVYNAVENPWGDGINVTTGSLPTGWAEIQQVTHFAPTCLPGRLADGTPYVDIRLVGTPSNTTAYVIALQGNTLPAVLGNVVSADIGACVIAGGTMGTASAEVGIQEMVGTGEIAGVVTTSTVATGTTPIRYRNTRTLNNASTDNAIAILRIAGHTAGVALDFTVRVCFPVMVRGSTHLTASVPVATLARRTKETLTQNQWGDGGTIGSPGTLPTNWGPIAGGLAAAFSGRGTAPDGMPYVEYTISGTSNGNAQIISMGAYNSGSPLIPALPGEYFSGEIGLEVVSISGTGGVRAVLNSISSSGGMLYGGVATGPNFTAPTGYARHRLTRVLDHVSTTGASIGIYIGGVANGAAFNCVVRVAMPLLWRGSNVQITDVVPLLAASARSTVPLYGLRGLMLRRKTDVLNKNPRAEGAVAGTPGTSPTGWAVFNYSGMTKETLASTTIDGIPCAKARFYGTATGGDGTVVAAFFAWGNATTDTYGRHTGTIGETVSISAFFGALEAQPAIKFRFVLTEYSGTGANLGFTVGAWQTPSRVRAAGADEGLGRLRVSGVMKLAKTGSTTFTVYIQVANASATTALDFTLVLGAPQLSKTSYAGPIALPDVGSLVASTVERDILSGATADIPYSSAEGLTIAAEFELMRGLQAQVGKTDVVTFGNTGSADGFGLALSDPGVGYNRFQADKVVSGANYFVQTNTVQIAHAANPIIRWAASWSPTRVQRYTSGIGEASRTLDGGLPTVGATFVIGGHETTTTASANDNRQMNGWMRTLAFYEGAFEVNGVLDKLPG